MIFLVKLLIFLKRLAAAIFIGLIWKPIRLLLNFVFHKIVVKVYKLYLYIIKKLGWASLSDSPFLFLLSQKSVHVAVVAITIILVFTNLVARTKAEFLAESVGKTILAGLIESKFGSLEEEQLIEEFFDEEATISPAQQSYLDGLTTVKSEPRTQINPFDELEPKAETGETIQGGRVLVKPDIASTKKAKRPRTETIEYIVKSGDSVSTIAQNFGISVSSILWENNLSAYSIIRPGNKLTILPVSGITHKVARNETLISIANKYKIAQEKIAEFNKLTDSSKLSIGQKLIIPGAKKTTYASSPSRRYSGLNVITSLVKSQGAKPVAGNKMNWPTIGHRITQYYSWRHRGIDIANKTGTPIYAADAGAVEYSGWGKGYGYQIVINHGGGKKTRYAHNSKLYAKKGQRVSKGETISAMGSTGWSTGPHVHFEIIINGKKYNPLNYIK